ncbi:hypothetical protein N8349_02715, partial [Gammaproteobacteria bacterium]|nr:hypothetical protein [Gammaproteobacteria bacterium]
PFVKIRLSEFNPNYSDAYDQVLDYLARYYLGPWANTGASTEVINLELASLNLQKSFLVAASNQDYINNILIQLAKINQDFPIPISTYKAVNQELLQNIELLASQDNNAGDWVKHHAAQIYRHHDKFLNADAELKMLLQLMKSDYNISSYYPERAAQIFFDKKEYKSATKYMEIALNDFDSKYAAWKLAEWYTETQEILDLNKAYSTFRKGDELGSDYSAIRRVGMLMDHKIDVSKEEVDTVIEKNILKFNDPSYFQSANFYDHVVLGYASGYASYTEDDDLLCHYASKGIELKSFNYISKLWNGWCVLIDERAGSKISALINLEELSDLGSSSATLFLAMYYQELEGLENLEKSLLLSRKALNQNKDKNYKVLNKKYSWVSTDALFFNADISFIRNLGDETKAEIKREKSYLANIKKVKEDKEKRKLAIIREQERVRSRQRTAEVTSGFFNFLGDALLVVGAIALAAAAVDVIADADPEVLDAMANSFNSYSYDWDGFYDQYGDWTYRCRTIETGRFAENYNCSGEYKDDDRWPSNY